MKEEKPNKKMEKNISKLVVGLVIGILLGLIIGGVASYFIFNGHRSFPRGNNFQLNLSESQISDVTSFFNSSHSSTEITSYCEQNSIDCIYYCRNINQNEEVCQNMNLQYTQFPPGGWS